MCCVLLFVLCVCVCDRFLFSLFRYTAGGDLAAEKYDEMDDGYVRDTARGNIAGGYVYGGVWGVGRVMHAVAWVCCIQGQLALPCFVLFFRMAPQSREQRNVCKCQCPI